MFNLLSFVNPLEFLLRYTVILGVGFMIIGFAIILMSKRITMAVRKTDSISKQDKVYMGLICVGLLFFLIGMICIALPIEDTLYTAK